MVDRSGGAPRGTLLEVVHELKEDLGAVQGRLERLEAPSQVRVRGLEVVDDEDRPVVRIAVRDDGTAGLECLRPGEEGLVAFVGVVDGHGALRIAGRERDGVVLDLGASERSGRLVFLDRHDPAGAEVADWMARGAGESQNPGRGPDRRP